MRRLTWAFAGIAGLLTACAAPVQLQTAAATPRPPTPVDTSLPPGNCAGFALSLASDHGGQPSPQAAAEWSVRQGTAAGFPRSGWLQTGRDEIGVTLTSGTSTLHVVQGTDKTWFVDQGWRC